MTDMIGATFGGPGGLTITTVLEGDYNNRKVEKIKFEHRTYNKDDEIVYSFSIPAFEAKQYAEYIMLICKQIEDSK